MTGSIATTRVAVDALGSNQSLERRSEIVAHRRQLFGELGLVKRSFAVHEQPHDLIETIFTLAEL
jgi:hypothetical protein